MRRNHYSSMMQEQRERWATIFELVSASVVLLLIALVVFLVLTYHPS